MMFEVTRSRKSKAIKTFAITGYERTGLAVQCNTCCGSHGVSWQISLQRYHFIFSARLHAAELSLAVFVHDLAEFLDVVLACVIGDPLVGWFHFRARKTISFDNGTEFAEHRRLHKALGVQTFFCNPHSVWQKGGVENSIGRLRRSLPRITDLKNITAAALKRLVERLNDTPRKCPDFKTSAEAFSELKSNRCTSNVTPSGRPNRHG
jgi:hypothetical protein